MLVLVIPQTDTSFLFAFNLRLHIIPCVTRIVFLINRVSENLKKSIQAILASQCPVKNWSYLQLHLATSGLLLLKVKEVCLRV